jgi:hypothetical protein
VNYIAGPWNHWTGSQGEDRYDFWRKLASVWAGRDVLDGEKVYLPPKGNVKQSVFWFKLPRLSTLLRPNVGDRAGLDTNDVQLYIAACCNFELRIRQTGIELFDWLEQEKEVFCEKLNTRLGYKDSDKEIELVFDRKKGNQKNQLELTSNSLEVLWEKGSDGDSDFVSRESWHEFISTITEIAGWFEDVALEELERFKNVDNSNQDKEHIE